VVNLPCRERQFKIISCFLKYFWIVESSPNYRNLFWIFWLPAMQQNRHWRQSAIHSSKNTKHKFIAVQCKILCTFVRKTRSHLDSSYSALEKDVFVEAGVKGMKRYYEILLGEQRQTVQHCRHPSLVSVSAFSWLQIWGNRNRLQFFE